MTRREGSMAYIYGTSGHDNADLGGTDLFGTDQNDAIYGYGGDDYINGRMGSDTIFGGSGHNTIFGGEGDDFIHSDGLTGRYDGGNGVDTLNLSAVASAGYFDLGAGKGNFGAMNITSSSAFVMANFESLVTGSGADRIFGTAKADLIQSGGGADVVRGKGGADSIFGGLGDDTLRGEGANDYLDGGDGHDELFGGSGADVLAGGRGNDLLDGGGGFDTASWASHGAAVTVDMRTGKAMSVVKGVGETDTLAGIEKVVGSQHADRIFAGATTEADGGAGDDVIWSGADANRLVGGSDVDMLSYSLSNAGVSVSLATGAVSGGWAKGDSITGFENLHGSAHNDQLTGNALDNDIFGGAGADVIYGGGGQDDIVGGGGADRLYGGSSADRFHYTAIADSAAGAANHDWIMDFQKGLDRIDLRSIDANAHMSGQQKFTRLIGNSNPEVSSDFTAGTISWRQTGDDTLIDINISDNTVNGFDAPEMQIRLDGLYAITWDDFVL